MSKFIKILISAIILTFAFTACQEEDFGLEDMDFTLLTDCMWVPDGGNPTTGTGDIPVIACDPKYPVYFNADGTKLHILHCSGGEYIPYKTYDAQVNSIIKVVTLSREGEKIYVAHISILNNRYLTVYFGDDEEDFVIYRREKMPAELSVGSAK